MKHIRLTSLMKPQNEVSNGKAQIHWKLKGKPVTIRKNGSDDEHDWTVDFDDSNKTVPYRMVVHVLK